MESSTKCFLQFFNQLGVKYPKPAMFYKSPPMENPRYLQSKHIRSHGTPLLYREMKHKMWGQLVVPKDSSTKCSPWPHNGIQKSKCHHLINGAPVNIIIILVKVILQHEALLTSLPIPLHQLLDRNHSINNEPPLHETGMLLPRHI